MLKVTEMSEDFYYNVNSGGYRIAFRVKENLWDLAYYPITSNPLEEWDWMTTAEWEDLADYAGWDLDEIPEIPFIEVAFAMYNWFGPIDTFGQSYSFTSKADALKILESEPKRSKECCENC